MKHMNDEVDVWRLIIPTEGCWHWIGTREGKQYGRMYWKGACVTAHRLVYELERGPIPDGMVLDHLCRNHSCVNPDHLEVVTPYENAMRGISFASVNAKKSVCVRGHSLSNAVVSKGQRGRTQRVCRECANIRGRAYRQRISAGCWTEAK